MASFPMLYSVCDLYNITLYNCVLVCGNGFKSEIYTFSFIFCNKPFLICLAGDPKDLIPSKCKNIHTVYTYSAIRKMLTFDVTLPSLASHLLTVTLLLHSNLNLSSLTNKTADHMDYGFTSSFLPCKIISHSHHSKPIISTPPLQKEIPLPLP